VKIKELNAMCNIILTIVGKNNWSNIQMTIVMNLLKNKRKTSEKLIEKSKQEPIKTCAFK
jgi:hypothetical protein